MEDNSTEMEKLISSFIEVTSSSREVAISVLETHQWNLNAAVSTFTKNEVTTAEPNVPNSNDEKLVRRNLTPFPNLRINIPFSSFSPFDGSSDYSPSRSRLRLLSPSPPRFYLQSKRTVANPFGRHTINLRQGSGDLSGGTGTDSDEVLEKHGGEDNILESSDDQSSRSMSGETVSDEFEEESQELITHTVTSWRNGYTVDDSSLKTLDDPENATFLQAISRLESPRELGQVRGQFKLIRREEENFTETQASAGSDSASTEPPALAALPSMRAKESAIERPEQSPRLMSDETVSAELQEEQQQDEPCEVFMYIVTIWKNGFTVDDSPLKSLDDPENAAFLERITRLESPRLLDPVRVQVELIRREEEDFNEQDTALAGSESVFTESQALAASPSPSEAS
ncbi:PREDICTED: plant UBX domain-containing protein 6-like [Camelina sativa]|uniref:Plant UBX domain-containing protein 6-like n=1 Tax=Camelina sativa TaxID=90675 RepID=A0ABM1QZR7_CAMSA|nr:PREDICTED: plant UBX domain-containing protein 6-like [Camelina sativa]